MKKIIPNLFIIASLLFFNQVFSQGNINPLNPAFVHALKTSNKELQEAIPFPVKLGYEAYSTRESTDFPELFDLRDLGMLPPVKTQSSGGCWAYSSMSTVESRMLMLGEPLYDLSDNNLKYCHGFFDSRSTNGNAWMATAYFARQSGPLLEEQDPHPGGTSQPGVDCPVDEAPAFFVRDSRYPPGDMATIKQLVMDIGSVWSLIYYNSTYFNDVDDTYFYGGAHAVNHVLNIVGWDDNKVTNGGVGAWICQNTYGPNWGEGGFVYVSYNDSQFLIYNAYFPTFDSYNEDSRVLLYDELGNYSSYGYGSEEAFALVKYPIYEDLIVDQIGTYAMAYGTQIEMELYGSFDETTGVLSQQLGSMSTKTTDQPGFYTYDLDESFLVYDGDEIFIKVKYNTPSYNWPIPIEYYIETYSDPFIETGVSWISANGQSGNWQAIGSGTDDEFDLCINVYGQVYDCYAHDFDCDCDVDIIDITMATYTYGSDVGDGIYDPIFDFDSDGDIDIVDMTTIAFNYGWECDSKSVNENAHIYYDNSDVTLSLVERAANDGFLYFDIMIEDVENLGGFELEFEFNSAAIEVLEIQDAGFIGSTGRQVLELENSFINQTGEISYSLTTLGSHIPGSSGSEILFSIKSKELLSLDSSLELVGGTLVQIDAQLIPFNMLYTSVDKNPQTFGNRIVSISPNPFNERTFVQYSLERESKIKFEIYDMFGNFISTVFEGQQKRGVYQIDIKQDQLSSGLYLLFYKSNEEVVEVRKLIFEK